MIDVTIRHKALKEYERSANIRATAIKFGVHYNTLRLWIEKSKTRTWRRIRKKGERK